MFEDSGLETLLSTTEEKLNLWQVLIYLQVQQGSDWLVVYMGGLVLCCRNVALMYFVSKPVSLYRLLPHF